MAPRRCCCNISCELAADNFNRADSDDPGPLWYGDAEIVSNTLLVNSMTSLVRCSPFSSGAFYAEVDLIDPANNSPFVIQLGDPNAAVPVLVTVTFSGTVGSGTMTIDLSGAPEPGSFAYDWENAVERITICYVPGFMVSAGPTISRTSISGFVPNWISSCYDGTGQSCWIRDTNVDVGNWHFVEGRFDNFEILNHGFDLDGCPVCDCHCLEVVDGEKIRTCLPEELTLVLEGDGCISGEYEMFQEFPTEISNSGIISSPSTEKNYWVSEAVPCTASGTDLILRFALECILDESQTYPSYRMTVVRYGDTNPNCAAFGFDRNDEFTESAAIPSIQTSVARSKPSSTCDPLMLEFPGLCEDQYNCNRNSGSCCGGGIESESGEDPPLCFSVTVTE
jgi:hypothetical protein